MSELAECPICLKSWPKKSIEAHVNMCLEFSDDNSGTKRKTVPQSPPQPTQSAKKPKLIAADNGRKRDFPFGQSNSQAQSIANGAAGEVLKQKTAPLADRLRPLEFEDYVGQEKAVGKNKMFRQLLETDHIPSLIFWGPPGCGKTTLAAIVSKKAKASSNTRFVKLSAVTSGVADVREVIKIAKNEMSMFKRKTILFVDEIHRFNKLQQDAFLPHVEDGTVILLGATTENPSFQVNNALLSRCRVIVLEKLTTEDIKHILRRGLRELRVSVVQPGQDDQHEIGVRIEQEALDTLALYCDGDARIALNGLQCAAESKAEGASDVITVSDVKESLQKSHILYDRTGEEHYNCASALQKSVRGGSADGAVYWLTRMLEGGEDPLFIARRLLVTASEDIGLADPQAMPLAVAAFQACQLIGMPECAINLAHCATYLARAPKSVESYMALRKARDVIKNHEGPLPGVPLHLRNASTQLTKELGYGKGYQYNPLATGTIQTYLPEELLRDNFTLFEEEFRTAKR